MNWGEIASYKGASILIDKLDAHLAGLSSIPNWRDGTIVYASETAYFCGRKKVLALLNPLPEVTNVSNILKRDRGTALHQFYQEKYLGPMGVLSGTWVCKKCGEKVEGVMPKELCKCSSVCNDTCHWRDESKDCRNCDKFTGYKYKETRVFHKEYKLAGKVDGIISMPPEEYVLEIKTKALNMEAFKTPFKAHIFQLQVYLHLLEKKNGLLVYIDRSEKSRKLLHKEFPVTYSKSYWDSLEPLLINYRKCLDNKILPEIPYNKNCEYCQYRKMCGGVQLKETLEAKGWKL